MTKENFERLKEKAKQIAKKFDNHTYTEVEIIIEDITKYVKSKKRELVFKEV
jgi:hypothetical protein